MSEVIKPYCITKKCIQTDISFCVCTWHIFCKENWTSIYGREHMLAYPFPLTVNNFICKNWLWIIWKLGELIEA